MDGTLLDSNHEWSPSFLSELKKLTDKGILFVAASGRQYYNI
ncbi:MAG: HAD family hydrolase, partial [Bacteroidales bacterium]